MSQHSEERVSDQIVPLASTARVIPFERPQSELQKAVQQRAQEAIDRERDRASQKAPAWRRVLVLALAAIPVVVTFGAAVGFVGALRQFNTTVFEGSKSTQAPAQQPAAAASTEPDVVLLQSYDKAPAQNSSAPSSSPQR